MKDNVLDLAEARRRRVTETESLRRQLLATQRTAGIMARQAKNAIDAGDLVRAHAVLQNMIDSGDLAARLLAEKG